VTFDSLISREIIYNPMELISLALARISKFRHNSSSNNQHLTVDSTKNSLLEIETFQTSSATPAKNRLRHLSPVKIAASQFWRQAQTRIDTSTI
jgi:hypothetical protein